MTSIEETRIRQAPDLVPVTPEETVPAEVDLDESKVRRVAFRVVAAVTSLWVLALMFFGLLELVLMWLPAEMLTFLEDIDLTHRAHWMMSGVTASALFLGLVVQLRRPAKRVAPLMHALVFAVGGAVLYGISGGLTDWLITDLTVLVLLFSLAFLHPRARQLVRMPNWDRSMTALAAIAAVPWLFFAFTQAQLQWRSLAGDTHAELEHWATATLFALLVVAMAFIGATDRSGWRLTAWIAAIASTNYGLHSLVYPTVPSAASTLWAVAAIAWGVAYAVTIIRRSRSRPATARGPSPA